MGHEIKKIEDGSTSSQYGGDVGCAPSLPVPSGCVRLRDFALRLQLVPANFFALSFHDANSRIRGDALRFYSFFAISAPSKKRTNAAREVSACTSLPGR